MIWLHKYLVISILWLCFVLYIDTTRGLARHTIPPKQPPLLLAGRVFPRVFLCLLFPVCFFVLAFALVALPPAPPLPLSPPYCVGFAVFWSVWFFCGWLCRLRAVFLNIKWLIWRFAWFSVSLLGSAGVLSKIGLYVNSRRFAALARDSKKPRRVVFQTGLGWFAWPSWLFIF